MVALQELAVQPAGQLRAELPAVLERETAGQDAGGEVPKVREQQLRQQQLLQQPVVHQVQIQPNPLSSKSLAQHRLLNGR